MVVSSGNTSSACTEFYDSETALSLTSDAGAFIGRWDVNDFDGYILKYASNRCVCEVYAYVRSENGDQTGKNYHMRIFTIDGNDDVDTIVGTSAAVSGSTINGASGTYIGPFIFSPCVNLTSGVSYPHTIFVDDDANLTDNPEFDGTNYWLWGYDNENNGDAIIEGRGSWTWDASIPYVDQFTIDPEDDGLIKASGQ